MTMCSVLLEDLTDAALGERISDELNVHLRHCRACTTELERRRDLARRMDTVVTRLVREQPPSELLPRALASVRRAGPRRTWAGGWPRAAIGAALAAGVVGATIGLHALYPAPAPAPDVARLASWHSPTQGLLDPHDSVLQTPLRDPWFDPKTQPAHSHLTPGGTQRA
jgi:hypothetical protein